MDILEEIGLSRLTETYDKSILPEGVRYLTLPEQRVVTAWLLYDLMEAGLLNSKGVELINSGTVPDYIVGLLQLNQLIEDVFSGLVSEISNAPEFSRIESNVQSPTTTSNIQFSEG